MSLIAMMQLSVCALQNATEKHVGARSRRSAREKQVEKVSGQEGKEKERGSKRSSDGEYRTTGVPPAKRFSVRTGQWSNERRQRIQREKAAGAPMQQATCGRQWKQQVACLQQRQKERRGNEREERGANRTRVPEGGHIVELSVNEHFFCTRRRRSNTAGSGAITSETHPDT